MILTKSILSKACDPEREREKREKKGEKKRERERERKKCIATDAKLALMYGT
jgi:hypothetical protein